MASTRSSDGDAALQLRHLIGLLTEKKESLSAGRCRLTLTARLTKVLCSVLYSSPLRMSPEGEGLASLLPHVRAVRVVSEDTGSSATGRTVNLSPFHHLTHLEIRSVEMGQVMSLSKLRSQLSSLVLYACLESLDEVLLHCGGDRCTDSFLWSELHTLHATSCQCLDLGAGLQLAPWLKTLNLSFNGLNDNSLLSLTTLLTLHHLTLNFNRLQRIPVLAPSARSTLKVLHLRQNQLDSLKGLEHLSGLEELDAAYNCISGHDALSSLCSLSHLVKLCLECNPISYSKDYRLLVVRRVSTAVSKKRFQLDGHTLSAVEKDAVGTMASLYSVHVSDEYRPPVRSLVQITLQAEETVTEEAERIVASVDAGGSLVQQQQPRSPARSGLFATPSTQLSLSAAKRRKASRTREVEIVDSDAHHQEPVTPEVLAPPLSSSCNGDSQHLTTKQQLEELRRTFGQENWLSSQAGSQVRRLLGLQETDPSSEERKFQRLMGATAASPVQVLSVEPPPVLNFSPALSGEENEDSSAESVEPLAEQPEPQPPVEERDGESDDDDDDDVHVFVVHRHQGEGEGEAPLERLLTVTRTHLHEKDSLSGRTLISWTRCNLQTVNVLKQSPVKVQLLFQSRSGASGHQHPIYTMDDDDYAEFDKLVAVKKAADIRTSTPDRGGDELSCMRCDRRFPSLRAAVRLRTVSSPSRHAARGQLEEYSVCPFCGSDMIFTVEQQHSPGKSQSVESAEESVESVSESDASQGSSDVVVAVLGGRQHSSSSATDSSANESEEGSVEVVDKSVPAAISTLTSVPLLANCSTASVSSRQRAKSLALKAITSTPSKSSIKSTSSVSSSHSSSRHSSRTGNGSKNGTATNRSLMTASLLQSPPLTPTFVYSYADFSQVDHRLRLYCEMFLLSHQSEEFHGLVKAELVAASPNEPMDVELALQPILLVATSHKLYFLKITGTPSDQPEKWLSPETSYPLGHLKGITSVIGHQGLRLQLGNGTFHLILLRDQRRTKNVAHFLIGTLEKSGITPPAFKTDLMAAQWSALDGLVRGEQEDLIEDDGGSGPVRSSSTQGVFLFCLVRVEWGGGASNSYPNAALMVTSDRIALVQGDPRWLLHRRVHFRQWGVALLSLQQVANLISLESFVSHPEQLRCYFLDEASNLEEKWTVTLATREAVDQLIEAVRTPWEAMFSVELEINELDE